MTVISVRSIPAVVFLTLVGITGAAAQSGQNTPPTVLPVDLCVICEEPNAVYRCRAAGSEAASAPPAGLQIKCVTEIAQRSGHGRCRIDRNRPVASCEGQLVLVDQPPQPLALPSTGAASAPTAVAPTAASPAPASPPAATKPPETMEALAKEAARASTQSVKETSEAAGKQIEKAGTAVGGAFKKSWDCVVSLFSRC